MLFERGIHGLTVRDIAERAGVAETTIYRRWGTSTGLAAEAVAEYADAHNPIPDTGNLERDLVELLRNVAALLEQPGVQRLIRFALSLDSSDEEQGATRDLFWNTRFEAGRAVIGRAVERGEVSSAVDGVAVIETLVGAAYVRTLLLARPIDDKLIDDSVGAALDLAYAIPAVLTTDTAR